MQDAHFIEKGRLREVYVVCICGVHAPCRLRVNLQVRPLFFISLFLVTSARSFRWELKKKKNRPLELSSEVRSEPNMIVHANNNIVSKRGLPLVCFKCGSASPLPVAEEVSSKFQSAHPVCQECFQRGCVFALEGRSRCAPDCHTR